jgi:hypothetical protein
MCSLLQEIIDIQVLASDNICIARVALRSIDERCDDTNPRYDEIFIMCTRAAGRQDLEPLSEVRAVEFTSP